MAEGTFTMERLLSIFNDNNVFDDLLTEQLFGHYTSLDAFLKISGADIDQDGSVMEMHASSVNFTSDSSEFNYGINLILQRLQVFRDSDNFMAEMKKSYPQVLQHIQRYLEGKQEPGIYFISFSEKLNLLSQWRAYGKYSIEFSRSVLESTARSEKNDFIFKPCIYSKKSQEKFIDEVLKLLFETFGVHWNNIIIGLLVSAGFLKHPSFSEEAEWRMIGFSSLTEPCNSLKRVYYKARGDFPVPFLKVIFERNLEPTIISNLRIGPIANQKQIYNALHNRLAGKHILVHVLKSSSPLEYS